MATKIFIMTHKKFLKPENDIYIPLHVGKTENEELGYTGDDTGDTISYWNKYFGELTGVYWVWKNCQEEGNVGVCHYRRFFINDKRKIMIEEEYENILRDYDIIVSNLVTTEKSYLNYYAEAHNVQDLFTVGEVIKEKYPREYIFFEKALAGSTYYYGNLMVTSKEKFNAYANWLFDILFEVQKRVDVSSYDLYNQRVYGFLSEQLLKVWIDANNLKAYENNIGITAEKAETVEFKMAISELIKQGDIAQTKEIFYSYTKLRPDIRLELSDIKNEIPIIEQIIYMCEQEKKYGIEGLQNFSKKLSVLMEHYRKLLKIFKRFSEGQKKAEDINYIIDTNTTWIQAKIILLNTSSEYIARPSEVIEFLCEIYGEAGSEQNVIGLRNN